MPEYKYLFGPIESRRFGRSLGIDLLPFKTCSYSCAFCQLGPTAQTTLDRREYVPTEAVLGELRDWWAQNKELDFMTLAGSGEPTLHTGFGDILRTIHNETPCKSLLLSNGSLMSDAEVRKEASIASITKLSLSAWDQDSLEQLMHPALGLTFEAMIEGYKEFRQVCQGELWLEIFLVGGVNDRTEQVLRIAEIAEQIQPDRIQLNTAVRPPAESGIVACDTAKLHSLAPLFRPVAEVVATAVAGSKKQSEQPTGAVLEAILRRHPMSVVALQVMFGVSLEVLTGLLEELRSCGVLRKELRGDDCFYLPAEDA